MVIRTLDSTLAEDHPARAIWAFLAGSDLTAFYAACKAVTDGPGRPATDPQVLLALWILATADGVGSARQLARLCEQHDAYRWLCGGVPINYHMLADFRVAHPTAVDDVLTQTVGCLMAAGLVTLAGVAQDGMRTRASAGASSFRTKDGLESCLVAAKAQVVRLQQQREHPDPTVNKRQRAARERAAKERLDRVERALALLPEAAAAKQRQQQTLAKGQREQVTEPRVSLTDPEARVMKMPDGGFRPAYNVELATDVASGGVIGAGATRNGTDAGEAGPMLVQLAVRTQRLPRNYLIDGGFVTQEDITLLERSRVRVYAPVRAPRLQPAAQRYQPHPGDSPEVVRWRRRMRTPAAQSYYRQRAATAEWANAQARNHGLTRFTVRGLANVTTVTLLMAVTHNILRWLAATTPA
jgi:transposase